MKLMHLASESAASAREKGTERLKDDSAGMDAQVTHNLKPFVTSQQTQTFCLILSPTSTYNGCAKRVSQFIFLVHLRE